MHMPFLYYAGQFADEGRVKSLAILECTRGRFHHQNNDPERSTYDRCCCVRTPIINISGHNFSHYLFLLLFFPFPLAKTEVQSSLIPGIRITIATHTLVTTFSCLLFDEITWWPNLFCCYHTTLPIYRFSLVVSFAWSPSTVVRERHKRYKKTTVTNTTYRKPAFSQYTEPGRGDAPRLLLPNYRLCSPSHGSRQKH